MGAPDADDEAMWKVLEQADAADFLRRIGPLRHSGGLPDGVCVFGQGTVFCDGGGCPQNCVVAAADLSAAEACRGCNHRCVYGRAGGGCAGGYLYIAPVYLCFP